MRLLVSCASCKRQFDAGSTPPGDRFRCPCGATLEVPFPGPHDAAVVRCSACGAPRQEGAESCGFCGADFTLHERDLHTICPECMARVSDHAKFCHSCGCALLPEPLGGQPTTRSCPACGPLRSLTSRRLGEPATTVLECPGCAGIWLGQEEFRLALERARTVAAPAAFAGIGVDAKRPPDPPPTGGRLYRPCPVCGQLMHRRNFGRKSAIIIDTCAAHGVWFDPRELDGILHWVRRGGERTTVEHEDEERRAAASRARLARQLEAEGAQGAGHPLSGHLLLDLLAWVTRTLLRP